MSTLIHPDCFLFKTLCNTSDNIVYFTAQKRMLNDRVINGTQVEVLQNERWESIPWRKLQVGDVVRVSIYFGFYFENLLQ